MKIGLIGGLLLVPAGMYGQAKMESPNIVIIEADDLGFGDLSCYGATAIQTSGMDRLANEGLRFTDAYCTAATSTPSRYSLLTGMYPWSNPQAKILPGNAALIIDTHRITLPKMMRSAGYVTGAVGNGILVLEMVQWIGISRFIREPKKSAMIIRSYRLPLMTGFHVFLSKMEKE